MSHAERISEMMNPAPRQSLGETFSAAGPAAKSNRVRPGRERVNAGLPAETDGGAPEEREEKIPPGVRVLIRNPDVSIDIQIEPTCRDVVLYCTHGALPDGLRGIAAAIQHYWG